MILLTSRNGMQKIYWYADGDDYVAANASIQGTSYTVTTSGKTLYVNANVSTRFYILIMENDATISLSADAE